MDELTIFENMIGQTMKTVVKSDEELIFTSDTKKFRFYHRQDCCEQVRIEEVIGDLSDLVDSPILQAEEITSEGYNNGQEYDSFTWTFYKFATNNGSVTVRWLGESNGYYSESVDFEESAVS